MQLKYDQDGGNGNWNMQRGAFVIKSYQKIKFEANYVKSPGVRIIFPGWKL